MEKSKSNFTKPKMYQNHLKIGKRQLNIIKQIPTHKAKNVPKSLKNRQMPIKHNKTNTYGDISALKGG